MRSKTPRVRKARLHTDMATDAVVAERGDHDHPTNAAGIEVAAAIGRMKRRAADTQDGNFFLDKMVLDKRFYSILKFKVQVQKKN